MAAKGRVVRSKIKPGSSTSGMAVGKVGEDRVAWLDTSEGTLIYYNSKDESDVEVASEVRLSIQKSKVPLVSLNLTSYTIEELEAVATFIINLINKARPIVKWRDQEAEEAFQNGDDSFSRSYRPLPHLVDRERSLYGDRKSVPLRPDDIPRHEASRGSDEANGGGDRPGLANPNSINRLPSHDRSQTE